MQHDSHRVPQSPQVVVTDIPAAHPHGSPGGVVDVYKRQGQAIKYARKGSTIILVAVFASMAKVDLAVLNDHELDLNTTMMYRNEDYLDAIRLVNEGKVTLAPLVSKHFAFRDYLKAYQYIDDNRETTMKVIINVQE